MKHPTDDDTQFYDVECASTSQQDAGHFELRVKDSGFLRVSNPEKLPLPKRGEMVRFYGKGFGYPVRGVACGDRVYYYQTQQEYEVERLREIAESKARKEKEFADKLPEWNARVEALPTHMRLRILFFMHKPGWGPEFGPYEMFCCETAAKIAAACKTVEAVKAFNDASNDEQRKVLADLSDHSGNTFGYSVKLAVHLIREPEILYRIHGALCQLVSCEDYGCWCTTEEAEQERKKRGT
ncbi:MAG: hypothetical protein WC683_02625 [bacterium]